VDERIAALADARNISLTTYRRDGRAVATPVWFVLDGPLILVWTDGASGKAKRIRANGRAAVTPSDGRGRGRGRTQTPNVDATARILPHSEDARAHRLFARKYRLLKPLVDLWTVASYFVRRKPRPVEIFVEITLT
jgi:uncharacterized protein